MARSSAAILELRGVRKAYRDFVAVDNLSLEIPAGTIFGLLGPNGAGKTSTIRMMIGITVPDGGEVRLFGQPFSRRQLRRVGYLPEERGLYRKMQVLEHLTFLGELYGLPRQLGAKLAADWCERLDLRSWAKHRIEELSKGMQQRVQFIAALLHQPEFVVLDEPFQGLDPVHAAGLKDVLLAEKKAGRAILFSTHRMDQVEKMCDRICLIDHGRAVLEGSLHEVKSRYGKQSVQIAFEGDGSFLRSNPAVEALSSYGNYVEVRLRPGADSQRLLLEAAARVRITRFELMEPSLEEIFLETVGKSDA